MATTHYSELKVYALSTPGVENACCEFDVESLRPTYRLLIGIPGKSNAFAISGKLGLPDYIIEDAKKRLSEQDVSFEDLLTDLETSKRTIEKEQEEIARLKREAEDLKAQAKQRQEKLDDSATAFYARQMKKQTPFCVKQKKLQTRRSRISVNSARKTFLLPRWKRNARSCVRRSKIQHLRLQ